MKKIIKIIIPILVFVIIILLFNSKNRNQNNTDTAKELQDGIQNEEIEELKQEYNMTGDNEIYNVETEYDGRKVLTIKPSVNYKVAFAGMIKKSKPEFGELDSIFESNSPTKTGIWIKKEDRKKILKYLNNNEYLKCQYEIDEQGYLKIDENSRETYYDQKIQNLINGDKQYVICISSVCYMVDPVTGKIIDYPYNELERYQTYEYFEDEKRTIIFVTENKDSKMTKNEIFESIIDLIEVS